ncbi:bacteriohopanetetrol glucosamine biosynthesis glycosyltransferase HpnI [Novosphingobium lentum]|uniref:bacteriohopanetetrol glucosamine biosynthesis glycosyltransferase HpnI n=1 Tax=Novosphingobium lentum TaxID=145287 RepID=UPI0008334A3E|nr:bacteriohopanetetrol glucosamine biosynthesis glycosyltransferase HpnI [Novosphingobium lentum]
MLMAVLWWTGLAITAAATAYLLLVIASVAAHRPVVGPGWPKPPVVTLLKPLCGLEDGLEEALASFLSQETTGAVRFVFGVADGADPALALARQVAARFARADCAFVVDAAVHGPNPKVSNLVNMAKAGLGEVVVISDSDIVIGAGVLQRAIDALSAPGVGAVTALYRSHPGQRGDRTRQYGGWFIDYWFLPMALLHARLTPLSVTYGPLTAIRGEVLQQVGGLAALADHLSDDAELGRLVRQAGFAIGFSPDVVETLVNDASLADLFDHELRWARTVRGLDPVGYVASVVSHPGPLPLLLLLLRPSAFSLCAVLVPVALRWCLARVVERRLGRSAALIRPGPIALWLRDMLCFAVWAKGLVVQRVGWRGQRLAVRDGDILQPAEPAA